MTSSPRPGPADATPAAAAASSPPGPASGSSGVASAPPARVTPKSARLRHYRTVWLAVTFALQLWWTRRTRPFVGAERQRVRSSALYTRQARRFTAFATAMGGLIIKLGQFLSVRIDILPREYIEELGKLQDAIPPVDTAVMVRVIEGELGAPLAELFASFDADPIAAASLGQVYRARLDTGADVAVKVLRPGVDDLIDTDLRSLRVILRLLDRFTTMGRHLDVDGFCADFEATFRDELDYVTEGRNAEAFQRNFLLSPRVEIPAIHWSHTTRRVLTMEFMDGVKINELDALDGLGVDRARVARDLLEIYLQMFLHDGFFHADPHPGNVFVRPDGVIQLIDFGMVGTIPDEARRWYASLIVAVLTKDADRAVEALWGLGFLRRGTDTRALKQVLRPLMDTMFADVSALYAGSSVLDHVMRGESLAFSIDTETLDRLREFILSQPISLPGDTTFIGKAFITVVSVCSKLDPAVDIVGVAEPYLKQETRETLADVWPKIRADAISLARSAVPTAKRLVALARKADAGELEVRLGESQWRQLQAARERDVRRIVWTVLGASVMLSGVLVSLLSAQTPLGVALAVAGAAAALAQAFRRSG